jgi:hypothetical protein
MSDLPLAMQKKYLIKLGNALVAIKGQRRPGDAEPTLSVARDERRV